MDIRVEQLAPARIAYARNVGPYCGAGKAWERLFAWAGPRGLCGPAMRTFALCHDDPDATPAEQIRYDACIAVSEQTEAEGDIQVTDFAGGTFVCATHLGPYETLAKTYGMLYHQWMPASGRKCRAEVPCVEFYLNDPRSTPPDQLRTRVCMPIE